MHRVCAVRSLNLSRPGWNRERISRSFAPPLVAERDCERVRKRGTDRQTGRQTERGKNGKRSIAIPDRGHRSLADKNAVRCYFLLLRVWLATTNHQQPPPPPVHRHRRCIIVVSRDPSQTYTETRHINYQQQ